MESGGHRPSVPTPLKLVIRRRAQLAAADQHRRTRHVTDSGIAGGAAKRGGDGADSVRIWLDGGAIRADWSMRKTDLSSVEPIETIVCYGHGPGPLLSKAVAAEIAAVSPAMTAATRTLTLGRERCGRMEWAPPPCPPGSPHPSHDQLFLRFVNTSTGALVDLGAYSVTDAGPIDNEQPPSPPPGRSAARQ